MPCPGAVSSNLQGSRRLLLWTHASCYLALAQGTEKPFTSFQLQPSWLCAGIQSPILQMRTLSLREEAAEIPLLQAEQESKLKSVRLQSPLPEISVVVQLCLALCDPMNCSMPGLPVHHQLPEFTQTHVHRVDDAIHPSHSLLSPSPPPFNLSELQGLFQ